MSNSSVAPYGTWKSAIDAGSVAASSLRFDEIRLDGDSVYWNEGRPSEGGRNVIVRRTPGGATIDMTPAGFNARARVHEYGGAAYLVHQGTIYFSNFADQRVYRHAPGRAPEPLTPAGYFYADFTMDARRGRLIAVCEDHTKPGEPPAAIVAVSVGSSGSSDSSGSAGSTGAAGVVLVSGADFYSDPIVSPDGAHLAWLQWNHPNMPWDGTELWVAAIGVNGAPSAMRKVAGGADESIFQPAWSPDGTLYFVSDRTGWWNLYRLAETGAHSARAPQIEPLWPMAAEFGKPQWTLSMATYAFIDARQVAAAYVERGRWKLAIIETASRSVMHVPLTVEPLESVVADARAIYFVGGSPTEPKGITRVTVASLEAETLRAATSERIPAEWISVAEAVTFRVEADGGGAGGGPNAAREVHAFYYAPKNPHARAPAAERPPFIVTTHGGPTTASLDVLDPEVQFWTSRGFAVLDVNYGGSTGYGRAYRDRLKGRWGIVDVEDAVAGARAMVAQGKADGNRLIIHGRSAGGYTTLAALTFHTAFKAGASYYGISDIEALARDTHKFESRYLDSLIGPYPARKDLYEQRSPIHVMDRLSSALILFQGLDDKVVPPNQSAMMADAARKKGLPVAYVAFEGEQHGFRKGESITRALEAELSFYAQVFGIAIADSISPVAIDNLRR
jgi:dipeptidyl aminopeptidase/acylaminoacyl peptidase